MALQDVATVNITLQGTGVTRLGFGIAAFFSSYRAFGERIREYSSITAVGEDFPTDSLAYIAANSFFSNTPRATSFKIARIESDATITPTTTTQNDIVSFLIEVNDGDSATVTYTVGAAEDEEAIVDGLLTNFATHTAVAAHVTASKVGTGSSATLKLTPTAALDFFIVSSELNCSLTYTETETVAQALQEVEEVDNDFYFFMSDNHTQAWVLASAAAIESRTKLYFFSNSEVGAIGTLGNPATDTVGKVFEGNYFRTVGLFHQDADTTFPEAEFVGYNAPFKAGKAGWGNIRVGIPASTDPSTGKKLTLAQKNNLVARNCNFADFDEGVIAIKEGKTMGGEWIDIMRGRDALAYNMRSDIKDLLYQQQGTAVKYTDPGINLVRSVVNTRLQRSVDDEFLLDFKVFVPKAADVLTVDKQNRVLNDVTFEATLQNAIFIVNVTGSLSY